MPKPNSYTQELADEIVERLSKGEPLAEICRSEGMPAVRTVSDWRKAHKDFDDAFLQARDEGFDALAVRVLNIARTPQIGIVEKLERVQLPPEPGAAPNAPPRFELQVVEIRREDMLGQRKLEIDTTFKLLSKWDPRRYGERLALDHGVQDSLADKLKAARERAGKR